MIEQDIPLINIEDDSIGRSSMVELIVDSINEVVSSDHQCVVYGIYGKWGEGKTSLMNFIKKMLLSQGKTDNINIVEFNPWLVNNDEALLREFFLSIMANADETARKLFCKYGSLAIFASKTIVNAVAPGLGNVMAEGIELAKNALEDSKDTLAELKKKVSEAIKKSGKHIVVMIDDVDRLDKEELHAVLRLIRQVADFENCIYIIAMDVDMVAKSIADYHGIGSYQDGRKFIDKIVQVPILLPQIAQCDMSRLIKEELATTLQDAVDNNQIEEIANNVSPFINNYRELKRYCNQLSFVLPHMQGEVNISDLCSLEAVKMVNAESYARIYECEKALRHIVEATALLSDDQGFKEAEKNFDAAKKYITEGLTGNLKDAVVNALESLFNNGSVYTQNDIDNKRLDTGVYFQKYFTQLVPSNLIPDRELDAFAGKYTKLTVKSVAEKFDNWLKQYSASEVKRAALYIIRKFAEGGERCKAASILAKALSVCRMAKGLPTHIFVDPDTVSSFVAVQIVYTYMFVQDEQTAQKKVCDDKIIDETFKYIFEKAELNYCMNLLCSSPNVFASGIYSGKNTLPILIKRFVELDFEGQFKYSKFLLFTLFIRWKQVDIEGFNIYARNLFVNPNIPFSQVLNKLIDGTDDGQDVVDFVGLFKMQIPQINERLQGESKEVRESHAAKIYASNYRPLLES